MPRNASTLRSTYKLFGDALESSQNLFVAVEDFCRFTYEGVNENVLHPKQARRVVALSFLAAVGAWEQFVEACFVRYVAGVKSISGKEPHLKFGPAASLNDAYAVISGRPGFDPEKNYLSWSVDDTLKRSSLFFGAGDPFKRAIQPARGALEDAVVIRNRIAHASQKSRLAFCATARKLRRGRLRQGYSVGDLLLESNAQPAGLTITTDDVLFDRYITLFRDLAFDIAG
jgi:hypothetical protein